MSESQSDSSKPEEIEISVSAESDQSLAESGESVGPAGAVQLGEKLRQVREARGESFSDVTQALKLSQRQLEAIESGNYEGMPGPAFMRGFIRSYARHLGLEAETLLARYDVFQAPVDFTLVSNAKGDMPVTVKKKRRKGKFFFWLFVLLLVLVLVGGYFDWFHTERMQGAEEAESFDHTPVLNGAETNGTGISLPQTQSLDLPLVSMETAPAVDLPQEPAPQPEAVAGEEAAQEAGTETGTTSNAAPATVEPAPVEAAVGTAAEKPALIFTLTKASWLEVYDASGASLYRGQSAAGSRHEFRETAPYRVVIGDPSGVALEYGGKPVDLSRYIATGAVARLSVQ